MQDLILRDPPPQKNLLHWMQSAKLKCAVMGTKWEKEWISCNIHRGWFTADFCKQCLGSFLFAIYVSVAVLLCLLWILLSIDISSSLQNMKWHACSALAVYSYAGSVKAPFAEKFSHSFPPFQARLLLFIPFLPMQTYNPLNVHTKDLFLSPPLLFELPFLNFPATTIALPENLFSFTRQACKQYYS